MDEIQQSVDLFVKNNTLPGDVIFMGHTDRQAYGFVVVGDNNKPTLLSEYGLYGKVNSDSGTKAYRQMQVLEEFEFLYYDEHYRTMLGLEYPPQVPVDFIPISTFIVDQWVDNEAPWQSNDKVVKKDTFHKMHSYIDGHTYPELTNMPKHHPKPVSSNSSMCVKQVDKKYTTRKSPPYPANACKGAVMEGNDGKMYVSKPNKNGVYKWILGRG